MVRTRLQYQTGQLHPRLFAYREGVGTADNIAAVLGEVINSRALIVFLDLKKAFELANGEAILHSLVKKGVQGKLLAWTRGYLAGRCTRVRFQGQLSATHHFENGTLQGGILSPFLFNVLMEDLVALDLGRGAHLFCYADDLQLVV